MRTLLTCRSPECDYECCSVVPQTAGAQALPLVALDNYPGACPSAVGPKETAVAQNRSSLNSPVFPLQSGNSKICVQMGSLL